MIKDKKIESRSSFLKKLGLALVSIFGLGLIGKSVQKTNHPNVKRYESMSVDEANRYIREMGSVNTSVKPERPPKSN